MEKTMLLIPIYQPDEKTVAFIRSVTQMISAPLVIVDDGSGSNYQPLFAQMEQLGADVLAYSDNCGKGFALKQGIRHIDRYYPHIKYFVTADGDGQHTLFDIQRLLTAIEQTSTNEVLLGTRTFTLRTTPWRSWLGNRLTSVVYYLSSGIWLSDTQTGLRAFSMDSAADLLRIAGERFEYEMNQLLELPLKQYTLQALPIATIYEENNEHSHFRMWRDSYLIYRPLLSFAFFSLSSALVDLLLFTLLHFLLGNTAVALLLATGSARLLSGIYNYQVNRKFVFRSQTSVRASFWRYGILFTLQLVLSWLGVAWLRSFVPIIFSKMLVDSTLFLLSFTIQKRMIFQIDPRRNEHDALL